MCTRARSIVRLLPLFAVTLVAALAPGAAHASGYSDAVFADQPIGYWHLNETSGTSAANAVFGGTDGTYINGPTLGIPGGVGGDLGVSLNGSSQWISVPYSAGLSPSALTVEAWIKPTRFTSGFIASTGNWNLFVSGTHLEFYSGSEIVISKNDISSTYWTHVAATYDGTRARLYINGLPVTDYQSDIRGTPATGSTYPLTIGTNNDGIAYGYQYGIGWGIDDLFQGGIDDVAVYDHALSATRIAAHYDAPTANEIPRATTDRPSISGTLREGSTLTAVSGTWVGSPSSFTYQWARCDADGTRCSDINGATGLTHTASAADAGHSLRVGITGTNSFGSRLELSIPTEVIRGGASLGSYGEAVVSDEPAAFWRLDDRGGATSIADQSGGNITAVARNGVTFGSAGVNGTDAYFDTYGHWIEVPHKSVFNNGAFTFEAWVYPTSTAGGVLASTQGDGISWELFLSGQHVEMFGGSGSYGSTALAYSNEQVPLNEWTLLTGVYDGSRMRIYMNGTEATYMYDWRASVSFTSTQPLYIATDKSGIDNYPYGTGWAQDKFLRGGLDDVSFYDHALTPARVQAHWDASLPAVPVNLTPPTYSGAAREGSTLTASPGTWFASDSLAYQWQRCASASHVCTSIAGANTDTYALTLDDVGYTVAVEVVASNAAGSTPATSLRTAPIWSTVGVATLAAQFRPNLLFDSSEPWRPLEIGAFLSEDYGQGIGGHQVCHDVPNQTFEDCRPIRNAADLRMFEPLAQGESEHIDIWGDQQYASEFTAPSSSSSCLVDNGFGTTLRDCAGGPKSAIYYDSGMDTGGYAYFDYWWFYRYNDYPHPSTGYGDHEGDWEGLTVVSDARGFETPAVVFAIFGEHKERVWALPEFAGDHVKAYVAEGTHATYPHFDDCSGTFGCLAPHEIPEGRHDGQAGWDWNDVSCSSCVQALPEGWTSWTHWGGKWGGTLTGETSPDSPGAQARFKCTTSGFATVDTTCDRDPLMRPTSIGTPTPVHAATTAAATLSHATAGPTDVPADKRSIAGACRNWLSFDFAILGCNPAQLNYAMTHHRLTSQGSMRATTSPRRRLQQSVPGLLQVAGPLLSPGDTVVVSGVPKGTFLVFQAAADHHLVQARFDNLTLKRGQKAVVRVVRGGGGPVVKLVDPFGKTRTATRTRVYTIK